MRLPIFCDWTANQRNVKGRMVLTAFRIAHLATNSQLIFVLLLPYLVCYRIFIEWFLNIEIPYKVSLGKGCTLFHGHALVINNDVRIGENCTIRHSTTIGNKQLPDGKYSKCPIIGDNVDIGSNVCIIGPVRIGNNVKIGAGTVIVKDVPSFSTVVGNPGRIIAIEEKRK